MNDDDIEIHEPPPVCTHRWRSSRTDVHTTPVEHVCMRTAPLNRRHKDFHAGAHICCCGAVTSYGGEP